MTRGVRRIPGPLRAIFLAVLGGEDSLLDDAERSLGVPTSPLRVYAASDVVSTSSGRFQGRDGIPAEMERVSAASVSLLLLDDARERGEWLAEISRRIAPGGRLLVVDHNAPRRPVARIAADLHLGMTMILAGHAGSRRRLRQSVGRELRGLGLDVDRLRLLRAELVQAVCARRVG